MKPDTWASAAASRGAPPSGLWDIGRESGRYLVVSGIALGCDIVVYTSLITGALPAAAAGAIGYAVGLFVHYVLSARWVFPDVAQQRRTAPTLAKFVATGLFGLTMTALVIGALTQYRIVDAFTAKGIAVALSYVAVYLLRRAYVFARG